MCKAMLFYMSADFKLFDSIGYRYYHDLDNEIFGKALNLEHMQVKKYLKMIN